MSLYVRTISVTRPGAQAGVGFQSAYAGDQKGNETPVLTGIKASIQARRDGRNNPVGLPGDGSKTTWYVFIPKGSAAAGVIIDRDIVTDDLGRRFQVISDYWNILGCRLTVERLEA